MINDKILELIDYTGIDYLKGLSIMKEEFFSGIADLIVNQDDWTSS